ncbi:hypothetical protein [Brevundimonas vesicularis]|uniref:hypothetical protein n=1 Tax=Brevundimonas vesicularis TaxID=41276 RepID=UPI0028ABCCB2|nr:hypothetical protein [Brevundimonas vesicularis]
MTKTTLFAAASAAAILFAGGAQAGSISGYFGSDVAGNQFSSAVTGANPVAAVTYQVASEKNVTAAAPLTGNIVATNTLTTPIVIGAGAATRDYLVEFTINGATVASTGLQLSTGPNALPTAATLVSNNNGVVTFLVSVPGGSTVESFSLAANVSQTAKNPITVAGSVTAVIGGSNIVVDTAASTVASSYSAYLKPISATSNTLTAQLAAAPGDDDYVLIAGSGTAQLASDFKVVNAGSFNIDLAGTDATPAILNTASLIVRGPVINDDVTVAFDPATGTAAATPPANTSIRTLTATEARAFAAGTTDLNITNNGDDEFVAGTYTVTWTPTVVSGFTAPAASTTDAGTVELQGTNFVAPWVSGTGLATSVIRVSNSNGTATAPVTIRMISGTQVVNGVATPFTSTAAPLVVGSVPARGDLQVTSAQLVAAFGNFTRADFRVTINQEDTGLVAKLRNTRDGQTFEQSLAE